MREADDAGYGVRSGFADQGDCDHDGGDAAGGTRGKVRLNDPVAKYLPEFAQNGKEDITVRQLLTHFSGLGAGSGFEDGLGREADGLRNGVCRCAAGGSGVEVHL